MELLVDSHRYCSFIRHSRAVLFPSQASTWNPLGPGTETSRLRRHGLFHSCGRDDPIRHSFRAVHSFERPQSHWPPCRWLRFSPFFHLLGDLYAAEGTADATPHVHQKQGESSDRTIHRGLRRYHVLLRHQHHLANNGGSLFHQFRYSTTHCLSSRNSPGLWDLHRSHDSFIRRQPFPGKASQVWGRVVNVTC